MRRGDRSGGLDGVLVVAKPSGPTSHDVVGLVRRLSQTRRVGHGGTLDPFAAGVLPVFLGRATRLVEYHLGATKRYRATICFGETSTTDDIDGTRTPIDGPPVTREAVEAGMLALTGPIRQVPPDYSAVQIEGRRAYQMARAGQPVELAPRDVVIHEFTLLEWDDTDPARPVAVTDVACAAGTYIRALARDLGASLGSGAYLGALVRTASGGFTLEDAVGFEALRDGAAGGAGRASRRCSGRSTPGSRTCPTPRSPGTRSGGSARACRPARRRRSRSPTPRSCSRSARTGASPRSAVPWAACSTRRRCSWTGRPSTVARCPRGLRARSGTPDVETARGLEALERSDRPVFVVVGVFDGLHLGHAYLLEHLVREATARGARPMVITFDHHPDEVITGSAPPLLCDPRERLALLEAAGVEVTVVVHFDQRLRETPYDAFVGQVEARVPVAGFLMTPDAAFGYQRAGTPEALAALGRERGFEVVVVPPFELDGHPVRSSEVRAALGAGDLALATRLLGRPHVVTGTTTARGGGGERHRVRAAGRAAAGRRVAGRCRGRRPHDEVRGDVADGAVHLRDVPGGTRVRVAFLA